MIRELGLAEEADSRAELQPLRPLGKRLSLKLPFTTEERPGVNVAAYVEGSDPVLQDELVLYVAHYDHVGFGQPEGGDSIWNGFIDNAAGSAILLEIARSTVADPPPRSVAFLFVTAEEPGLLGSNWFVHEPPVPLERIRAVINIDGGAPPARPVEWGLVGADESPIGPPIRQLIGNRGWEVRTVPIGPQSDHWPFHRAGVPTLMLFPGDRLEGLSTEEAEALRERWLRPHTPHDEWSAGFPFSGLQRYAELAFEIGRALAEGSAPTD
jgi:Zn-dependent M28 family amino/carboxypeptidase